MSSPKVESFDIDTKISQLCSDYLSGAWRNAEPGDLLIQQLSGGLTNHVYYCSLPKGTKARGREPVEVLVRLYGRNSPKNVVMDNVVFTLLSERNLGPKLYGVFAEGRLEEYIPARSMYPNEIRDINFSLAIAKKIARVHSMDIPVKKDASMLPNALKTYLSQVDRICMENVDAEEQETAAKVLACDLAQEVNWLIKFMSRMNSPIVFCHHDLQGGNILVRHEEVGCTDDRIVFIDYEFAAYGYRAFDLANHFCEWMFDYTNKEYPYYYYLRDKFPSRESQMQFFYEYIQCAEAVAEPNRNKHPSGSKNKSSSASGSSRRSKSLLSLDQQAEILYKEVQAFLLGPHLLWALWGITQSDNKQIKFGYWKYAEDRLNEYFTHKNALLIGNPKRPHTEEEEEDD